jgi:arginyl-tRNA synthetase
MIELKKEVSKNLLEIVKEMGIDVEDVVVEIPSDTQKGDLSTNIAMRISKELKSNPMDIAKDITSKYPKSEDIEKIDVVKPGFINFFFSDTYLLNTLNEILTKKDEYFKLDQKEGERYLIEYTDPNPFKTFHIGHLYTNMVGESFACLTEALGASVKRANYQGDVGLHVAKTMWGLEKMLSEEGINFENLKEKSLEDRVRYLGDAYMLGFKVYDDEKVESVIQEIKDINYYLFSLYIPSLEKRQYFSNMQERNIEKMYREGREWCLEYFERIYQRTGTKFDKYYFESQMGEKGLEIVKENMDGNGKNIFEKSEGSVVYRGDEQKGLHTRVFVNSEGLPTYESKEIALALQKFVDFSFDKSITITANEQSPYFKVVFDALSQLNPEVAKKSLHFSHGMVKLPGAEKMSSRKGKIIEGEWLLNETQNKVKETMRSSGSWSEEEIEEISDKIAIAAIKYSFIKVSVGKDVVFDINKATSFDGDTGPYLLYVYARCRSILKEAQERKGNYEHKELNPYIKGLLRVISKYQGSMLTSSVNYSPTTLCTYLFELGQLFNNFYQNVKVLGSEDEEFLLGVVESTALTMKNGLKSLGIEVVERM